MKNYTNIKIPKKYEKSISSVHYEGKEDGYWVYLRDGFISSETECSTIHEWTTKDLLNALKTIEGV